MRAPADTVLSLSHPLLTGFVDPGPANLVALTEGVHSKEALELVREHLLGVMGPAAGRQFSSELIKMSKFQIAQVCVGARGRLGARCCCMFAVACLQCWNPVIALPAAADNGQRASE